METALETPLEGSVTITMVQFRCVYIQNGFWSVLTCRLAAVFSLLVHQAHLVTRALLIRTFQLPLTAVLLTFAAISAVRAVPRITKLTAEQGERREVSLASEVSE